MSNRLIDGGLKYTMADKKNSDYLIYLPHLIFWLRLYTKFSSVQNVIMHMHTRWRVLFLQPFNVQNLRLYLYKSIKDSIAEQPGSMRGFHCFVEIHFSRFQQGLNWALKSLLHPPNLHSSGYLLFSAWSNSSRNNLLFTFLLTGEKTETAFGAVE